MRLSNTYDQKCAFRWNYWLMIFVINLHPYTKQMIKITKAYSYTNLWILICTFLRTVSPVSIVEYDSRSTILFRQTEHTSFECKLLAWTGIDFFPRWKINKILRSSYSWEVNSGLDNQEILTSLLKQNLTHSSHNSLPLIPIPSQTNSVKIFTYHFFKTHLNVSLPSTSKPSKISLSFKIF